MDALRAVFFFSTLVTAHMVHQHGLTRREASLDIDLEMTGNTAIKAVVTNMGTTDLRIFRTGTLLDDASATETLDMFEDDDDHNQLDFDGIRFYISLQNLGEAAFQEIPAGANVTVQYDMAEMYDLSPGGAFDIRTIGDFYVAEPNSTTVSGFVKIPSSSIRTTINGTLADAVRRRTLHSRTLLQSDCSPSQAATIQSAIGNCSRRASAAQAAASTGPASLLDEFFKSSSDETRSTVSAVFGKLSQECSSTTSGSSKYFCNDADNFCASHNGVIAYTTGTNMVSCPDFFGDGIKPKGDLTCELIHKGQSDQTGVIVHEMTHLRAIKGTDDFSTYGYKGLRGLSGDQNLNHADTYTFFAAAAERGCVDGASGKPAQPAPTNTPAPPAPPLPPPPAATTKKPPKVVVVTQTVVVGQAQAEGTAVPKPGGPIFSPPTKEAVSVAESEEFWSWLEDEFKKAKGGSA